MRRKISLFLLLVLFVGVFSGAPVDKVRANSARLGNFTCELLDDGTIAVERYYGAGLDIDLVIPAQLEGYTVSQVGDGHFNIYDSPKSIRSITISPGIERISNHAFDGCTNAETISVPDSVEYIGEEAFEGCATVANIHIPENVMEIGERAFFDCESLTTLSFPGGLSGIGKEAFFGCTSLSEVTFEDGDLFSVGEKAFYNTALTEVSLPMYYLESIGDMAFGYYAGAFYEDLKVDGFIIRGIERTGVADYAERNGIAFIGTPRVSIPVLTPKPGTYYSPQTVSISCDTPGAQIYYYTQDDDVAIEYTGPITISKTTKISVYAMADGYADSEIKDYTYCINKKKVGAITCKSKFTKYKGDKFNLKAKKNTGGKLTYKSNKPSVASVNSKGKVTCRKPGTATITIKLSATSSSKAATKKVKVVVKKKLSKAEAKARVKAYIKKKGQWHDSYFYMFEYFGKKGKNYKFRFYWREHNATREWFNERYYMINYETGKIVEHW